MAFGAKMGGILPKNCAKLEFFQWFRYFSLRIKSTAGRIGVDPTGLARHNSGFLQRQRHIRI
ncbi:hypothetical protein DQ393_05890 [Rhizobium tropici]|uniref:Uncharacterized protein n=1 Tax=Rhizobium tropici TaxID=398 RepID=A0A329YEK6_RHITR|nr:hypothetical protein DQ393_05890 [Rhizobium tropici]